MYIPDWHFVKRLKAYDDKLSARWIPRKERWGIYRNVPSPGNLYNKDVLVHVVQGAENSYLPLDERVLVILAMGDHHRRGRDTVIREMIDKTQRYQEILDKDNRNDMADVIADTIPSGGFESNAGARNIPKEDMQSVEEYTEERELAIAADNEKDRIV
tara:strand:+ start:1095 stop:1568 length:474 start_codon:yes stop_codon:yes gene_type:complete